MKKVSIPVFIDSIALPVIGVMEILNKVNGFYKFLNSNAANNFFQVELVALEGNNVITENNYPIYCHKNIADVKRTDLVLIPAVGDNIDRNLELNEGYVPWIFEMQKNGAELGSICTGAFLLAKTGLVNGKKLTTHWYYEDKFKEMFPKVYLDTSKLIIEDYGYYSCGGANAYLSLLIYLIEKFCGKETAVLTSKMLMIDYNSNSQMQYSIFNIQKKHKDEEILKAQIFMEENFKKEIKINDVISELHLSKRNFIRRFKKATGNAPIEYLQRIKVEAVKRELESSNDPIPDIIYNAGYKDAASFRQIFRRYTGLSPTEYRKKFNFDYKSQLEA